MDANPALNVSELQAQMQEERLKHQELMEIQRSIGDTKLNLKKIETHVTEVKKELDDLEAECVDLAIKYDLEVGKERLLKESIEELKEVYNDHQQDLDAKYQHLYEEMNDFIEKCEEFLDDKNSEDERPHCRNEKENCTDELLENELEAEISALELYIDIQKKLLVDIK